MNTYLIPYSNGVDVDILKMTANSFDAVKEKIQNYYISKFDSDELADAADYEDFIDRLDDYGIYLGDIHELEEYE